MARSVTPRRPWLASVALWLGVAACSVINSYDEVVPAQVVEPEGGSGGGGGADAPQGGTPVEPTAGGGVAGTPDTPVGGMPPSGGGEGGAPDPGPPTTGLVVVGGKALKGSANVLVAVNPEDGAELLRENIPGAAVVGLAYDGAAGKDLWFVFTSGDFPADSMTKADLQVRSFNDLSRKWLTRRKVTALPPPRPNSFVVLNDRLAYLSFGLVNNVITDTLTILDTSTAIGTKQVTFDLPLTGRVLGLVGTRGVPGDSTALGGTLAIASGDGCTGTGASLKCTALSFTPIFVGDEITAGAVKKLRGFTGRPVFASSTLVQRAFVALPAVAPLGNVDLIRFDPRGLTFESPQTVITPAHQFAGFSLVECLDVTVLSSLLDLTLWATSAQGASGKAARTLLAQDVVYEPFTSSVVTPFNPDSPLFPDSGSAGGAGGAGGADQGPELSAYRVAKPGVTPSLKLRTADWQGLSDVGVNVAAARFPVPFACP